MPALTHHQVLQWLRTALEETRPGHRTAGGGSPVLPGSNQLQTNVVGLHLALEWARFGRARRELLAYVSPHRSKGEDVRFERLPEAMKRHFKPRRYEFLVDVFVTEASGSAEAPVLAAEIEAAPNHNVSYRAREDFRDYYWDCNKLFYVSAPRKLFVACVRKGPSGSRLQELEQTLSRCWSDSWPAHRGGGEVAVVILPAGAKEWPSVRIGLPGRPRRLDFRVPEEIT